MQFARPSSVISLDPLDADAQTFIRDQGLQPWIDEACQLITACFDIAGNVTVEKDSDPEFADEWITLRIIATGEMEAVLDGYDAFTREIVRILPPELSRKVRLSVGMA